MVLLDKIKIFLLGVGIIIFEYLPHHIDTVEMGKEETGRGSS